MAKWSVIGLGVVTADSYFAASASAAACFSIRSASAGLRLRRADDAGQQAQQ